VILDIVDLDGEAGVLEQAIWKEPLQGRCGEHQQERRDGAAEESSHWINDHDRHRAPLSHTDLQNRRPTLNAAETCREAEAPWIADMGLGLLLLMNSHCGGAPTQRPMSQSNRADGIQMRR
jgi:hypothetical protein